MTGPGGPPVDVQRDPPFNGKVNGTPPLPPPLTTVTNGIATVTISTRFKVNEVERPRYTVTSTGFHRYELNEVGLNAYYS